MAVAANFLSNDVKAYAVLDLSEGSVTIDISRISADYTKNKIPHAAISVTLGRDVATGLAAEIHHVIDFVLLQIPIVVWVQITHKSDSFGIQIEDWPNDPFKLIEGKVVHSSMEHTRDSISLKLEIRHWLGDLAYSSVLTKFASAVSAQQLSGLAGFQSLGGMLTSWTAFNMSMSYFTPVNISLDMWALAFGSWFKMLSSHSVLTVPGAANLANAEALDALNRFEPYCYPLDANGNPGIIGFDPLGKPISGSYRFAVPLQLPNSFLQGFQIPAANAIAVDVGLTTFASLLGTTIWDKLISFAGEYQFTVIPLIETALVVPEIAGMQVPWQAIYGEEYDLIAPEVDLPRAIRGVNLFIGAGHALGPQQPGTEGFGSVLAGVFVNDDIPEGMLHFENAPNWMANVISPAAFGAGAMSPFGVKANAMFPGVGAPPTISLPSLAQAQIAAFWNLYAQAVYVRVALKGRTATLRGRLRFDIAPGSTVKIFAVDDPFIKAQVGELPGDVLYAEVETVSIEIDSEAPGCFTSFKLQNLRNSIENGTAATSIPYHPLYNLQWNGAPLSEAVPIVPAPDSVEVTNSSGDDVPLPTAGVHPLFTT